VDLDRGGEASTTLTAWEAVNVDLKRRRRGEHDVDGVGGRQRGSQAAPEIELHVH
jgi:hypothetical protein